ncbi:MAG: hypothetical protein FRX48_06049 [Lasallia pustulata]|uniref:Uncharacterized protein n=1 Tax=Lasallia pustulata TaxID=136370 RepID=A0A5M8PM58_9LECA|nr:MAG: hypothetical protein FRX48_06049 [Lasallia pustulata]
MLYVFLSPLLSPVSNLEISVKDTIASWPCPAPRSLCHRGLVVVTLVTLQITFTIPENFPTLWLAEKQRSPEEANISGQPAGKKTMKEPTSVAAAAIAENASLRRSLYRHGLFSAVQSQLRQMVPDREGPM